MTDADISLAGFRCSAWCSGIQWLALLQRDSSVENHTWLRAGTIAVGIAMP